jgi:hypothetical protein
MVNNVGTTKQTLNTKLGEQNLFSTSDDITVITGEIDKGFLVFDPSGTLGVITNYVDGTNFTVTTHALSIDINTILNLEY